MEYDILVIPANGRGSAALQVVLYCASHKNWIRNIRFSIMNRPLSQ